MRILIAGICGFVGSILARGLLDANGASAIIGIDNLSRAGSDINRVALRALGIDVRHGDVRNPSDLAGCADVDWVIDAAANPAVGAGLDGRTNSRQLMEHNLLGTVNLLELCRQRQAGFILLSTSRVYSIAGLRALPLDVSHRAFRLASDGANHGVSARGIAEEFSTDAPLSLYGAAKRASEVLALEYGQAFALPVWINRCGLMSGAGQFGRSDQGVVAFWVHAWRQGRALTYLGYGGQGAQVRDCLHPRDLVSLLVRQMTHPPDVGIERIVNVAGGAEHAISLAQLSDWCTRRFGVREVGSDPAERRFDVPWLVLDASRAEALWDWRPATTLDAILEEIAAHAEEHPRWLEMTM